MKILKQILQVLSIILFFVAFTCASIWMVHQINKPDTRTIEQVREDRYKECITYRPIESIFQCEQLNIK